MKIKEDFILSEIGGESLIVPTEGAFSGVVRINSTAKFIVECLGEEMTREDLLDKMEKEYDAKREELEESVDITLDTLREIGALVE